MKKQTKKDYKEYKLLSKFRKLKFKNLELNITPHFLMILLINNTIKKLKNKEKKLKKNWKE
jgi:hypothetical protein